MDTNLVIGVLTNIDIKRISHRHTRTHRKTVVAGMLVEAISAVHRENYIVAHWSMATLISGLLAYPSFSTKHKTKNFRTNGTEKPRDA